MAKAKAAKKTATATKKSNGAFRATSVYTATAAGKKEELKGQGAVVMAALLKKPGTMAEIAAAAAPKLTTKQEAVRVVNHYLGKFKAAKLVTAAKAA